MYHFLALLEFLALGVLPADLVSVPAPASLALLVVAVGATLVSFLVRGTQTVPSGETAANTAQAMRRRSDRRPVLTLCDPDAAGRPRPRAPGAALPTAR